ncbi:Translation machinery-associated protein 46 [Microbotryomycetes sp. JL201]|nr:Translation machinery-associated protein 46 [Microbotryomycetes sp. JL201]
MHTSSLPPKKQQQQKQGSANKVKADLTFGLKNKNKSAKVQAHVQQLQQQAAQRGKGEAEKQKERERQALLKKKEDEKRKKEEMNELFKPIDIVQPKVPFGVDPKSVLCAFHKAGRCQKGSKCKYSHDLNQERKAEKASIYADQRDEQSKDTMDKWDDEKLRQVVSKKGNPQATTDIVCKYFIEAVENGTYGWFWECPNGGQSCKYRHALPPGFVLKSQKKKDEDAAKRAEITLEEFLEVERHKLDHSKLTPVTKESFAEWKKTRMDKRKAEEEAIKASKSAAAAAGKHAGLSGREMLEFNAELFEDESEDEAGEDEWDLVALRKRTEEERRLKEEERIRALEGGVASVSLQDGGGAA